MKGGNDVFIYRDGDRIGFGSDDKDKWPLPLLEKDEIQTLALTMLAMIGQARIEPLPQSAPGKWLFPPTLGTKIPDMPQWTERIYRQDVCAPFLGADRNKGRAFADMANSQGANDGYSNPAS
jgi:hypothetical protein